MMLGLGLFASGQAHGAAYNPAGLSLTGWWRTNFSATPWVGTASAGSSGSRNITDAIGFSIVPGPAINGRDPLGLDGTDDYMSTGVAVSTFLPGAGAGLAILFKVDSTVAAAGTPDTDESIIASASGRRFSVSVNNSGLRVDLYNGDGSTWTTTGYTACSTGAWHWVFVWWDATKIYVQLDSGAVQETNVSAGSPTPDAFHMRIGVNYLTNKYFDGSIAEILCKGSAWSGTDVADIRDSYSVARYGAL